MLSRVYWCYSYIYVAHLSLAGASVRATALTMTRYYFTMGDGGGICKRTNVCLHWSWIRFSCVSSPILLFALIFSWYLWLMRESFVGSNWRSLTRIDSYLVRNSGPGILFIFCYFTKCFCHKIRLKSTTIYSNWINRHFNGHMNWQMSLACSFD